MKGVFLASATALAIAASAQAAKGAQYDQMGRYTINDGMISKDGRVTRFDDQDDILAAKRNGPIDKMLDGNSKVMRSLADINTQQLNVLIEIRNGINALQSSGGLTFSDNSLTKEFYA